MTERKVLDESSCRQAVFEYLPEGAPVTPYLSWALQAYGSPPLYHLASMLALSSFELVRRGFRLPKITGAGDYPLTLWFCLVGDSGTGKSTAINAAMDFSRDAWKAASIGIHPDPWLEPEGTIPGLTFAIQEHYDEHRGTTAAILYHHEASAIFATKEPISETICKLTDGRTVQSNMRQYQKKRNKDPNADKIVNPRLSALFATTEAQLLPVFKESQRSGGMFTRLLWLRPAFSREDIVLAQDHMGGKSVWDLRELAIDAHVGWYALLGQLQLEFGSDFKFTAEAHAALESGLFSAFRSEYSGEASDDNWHGVKMRLCEKARVLATLRAGLACRLDVLPEDVAAAGRLVEVLEVQARAMAHLGSSETYRVIRKVERCVLGGGDAGILKRELYAHMRVDKRTLDAALETLSDKGVVFKDYRDKERAGRLVHVSTSAGRTLLQQQEENAALQAELEQLGAKKPWGRNGGSS